MFSHKHVEFHKFLIGLSFQIFYEINCVFVQVSTSHRSNISTQEVVRLHFEDKGWNMQYGPHIKEILMRIKTKLCHAGLHKLILCLRHIYGSKICLAKCVIFKLS